MKNALDAALVTNRTDYSNTQMVNRLVPATSAIFDMDNCGLMDSKENQVPEQQQ